MRPYCIKTMTDILLLDLDEVLYITYKNGFIYIKYKNHNKSILNIKYCDINIIEELLYEIYQEWAKNNKSANGVKFSDRKKTTENCGQ